MKKYFQHRFGPLLVLLVIIVALSFIVRVILMAMSWQNENFNPLTFIGVFAVGLFFDVVVWSFFAIPLALYCWLLKDSWYQKKWNRIPLLTLVTLLTLILVFSAFSEVVFWQEYETRFNFIAVDYLIYTTEVIENIVQSYNMPLILSAIGIVVLGIVFSARKKIFQSQQVSMRFGKRTVYFGGLVLFACAGYFLVNNYYKNISGNKYVNELAGNGIYEFGHAYWHNEIDFNEFYQTRNDTASFKIVRELLAAPNARFTNDVLSVERVIKNDSPEKKWNVVLISVESLSGDYLKHFGGKENITPYLDSLVPHSLFFENFYATGTRTVRGLEALSLAIPPTPGQSIVRRPGNEDMFTMGNVLKAKGYDVNYVYGGNSFFDNMGYFFSHNGYNVLDIDNIPKSFVHHTTAWGIDDEGSFDFMLTKCDESFKNGKLFFNHIMTVSNHRPYTFPEGRIDIPSKSQTVAGGVKYTDYAINKFLKDAQAKPWFANTIFIIVADHCSKSAGKTDLPVNRYHIPCFIYAPGLVSPKIETRLTSQVDLIPTVFGLMNLNYTSNFMGFDIYKTDPARQRIFISTYQDIGYIKDSSMVVLSPQKKIQMYKPDFGSGVGSKITVNDILVNEAIAWYQTASYLFKTKKYKSIK